MKIVLWKKIKDFEDYSVSTDGRIFSTKTNKELLLQYLRGYFSIGLRKNGKTYRKRINRLVAEAFVPNLENKPYVNHIDAIKTNNNVRNLEWVTHQENIDHAVKMGGFKIVAEKMSKSVCQLDKNTLEVIKIFQSVTEANKKTGTLISKISACANGNVFSANGYRWAYMENGKIKYPKRKNEAYSYVRKIKQIDKDTNEVIKIYNSAKEASTITGLKHGNICTVARGERKHCGGFKWEYINRIKKLKGELTNE